MIIDKNLLDDIESRAAKSPRLRMNYNFHQTLDSKSQRLLNVLMPGTELAVHRHTHTDETYVLLRGKLKVIFYKDSGEIAEEIMLDPSSEVYGINIPAGQWHTVDVIEPAVIFESKDGPYMPLGPQDVLNIKK